MARRRQNFDGNGGPNLNDVSDGLVVLECSRCDRHDAFERKVLVRQFGATACLAKLRRRLAMGCDRMTGSEGDQCETRFPCLDVPSL